MLLMRYGSETGGVDSQAAAGKARGRIPICGSWSAGADEDVRGPGTWRTASEIRLTAELLGPSLFCVRYCRDR